VVVVEVVVVDVVVVVVVEVVVVVVVVAEVIPVPPPFGALFALERLGASSTPQTAAAQIAAWPLMRRVNTEVPVFWIVVITAGRAYEVS
jgi:hypothetical protein